MRAQARGPGMTQLPSHNDRIGLNARGPSRAGVAMRLAGVVLIASALALSAPAITGLPAPADTAQAQSPDGSFRVAAKAKKPAPKKPAPKGGNEGGNYATMPLPERVGIQYDLAWAVYFTGLITG